MVCLKRIIRSDIDFSILELLLFIMTVETTATIKHFIRVNCWIECASA